LTKRATNAAFEDIGNGAVLDPATRGKNAAGPVHTDYHDDLATELIGMDGFGAGGFDMGDEELAERMAMQDIEQEEEDPNLPPYLRPDQKDLEFAKDSGSQFLFHLQKFVLKKTCPINFIRKDFKELLSSTAFDHKAILIYFHRPDQPQRNNLLLNLLTDNDFSRMLNNCFHPFGMLSNSKEMPLALKLIEYKFIPCMLVLRQVVESGTKRVKVELMVSVPLKSESIMVDIDVMHTKFTTYLANRNKEIDDIPQNIGNRPAKFSFPLAGESRVKKLQQLEREREMKEMQERKYYEMLTEETAKAEQAELVKLEQEIKAKQIGEKRANYEKMVADCTAKLTSEPTGSEPKIQIALRLASGVKVTRSFRLEEPIEVSECLHADVEMLHVRPDNEARAGGVADLQIRPSSENDPRRPDAQDIRGVLPGLDKRADPSGRRGPGQRVTLPSPANPTANINGLCYTTLTSLLLFA
jgi:hypothetical protein